MKDLKRDYWTVDIWNGAVRKIREHNFSQHEIATKNRNGCSSPGCKNFNLIRTQGWRNWCSTTHAKNYKIVPNMDNHLNYGKGRSSVNLVHVDENWLDLASYNQGKHQNYRTEDSCFTQTIENITHEKITNLQK